MIYVDSDDTISDFTGWCLSIDKKCVKNKDQDRIGQIIVQYRDRCFLEQKVKPCADVYLDRLREDPDCMVLTSLSSREHMSKFCVDVTFDELDAILRENKYKWFENHGIPRDKVIIIKDGESKADYCKEGDILYDDQWKNLIPWKEAGGVPIKVGNKYWGNEGFEVK